jgi:hypothetical protein
MLHVRLETIKYGAWDALEVAIDINQVDGKTLYLTYPTAETILNYEENNYRKKIASKSFKAFVGNDLIPVKISGRIVNKTSAGNPTVNLTNLDSFLAVAGWEAFVNQNIALAKLLSVGFGDSLRSLAYEQLGLTLTQEDRQNWIKKRQENIDSFWLIGEATESYKSRHPELSPNTVKHMYSNYQDAINRGLFGKPAKQIREILGLPDGELLRNHYGKAALVNIESIQRLAAQLINQDVLPLDAVKQALSLYKYPVIDFKD